MKGRDLRSLALQLATQLPPEREDALRVLDFTRELLVGWLYADRSPSDEASSDSNNVVSLKGRPETSPL
jgi:hypothetical protein